ncbi:hypothetical protein PMES_02588 [Profundibacterium mesophilum KAUST100406-0324]|uniref:Uncharacterized protein n=2 Tax=Profundibacterium TaxID=1258570 RepID=A0A921NP55_9RHOB|nr:hypothetical protein PMES_02588 [Profundibacterium mesophilum KAUST100406-0324]
MERRIITIPPGLFAPTQFDWDIDWRAQSAGETGDGVTRTVFNAFPRWIGSPSVVLVHSQIAAWRAIRAQAQGAVGVYRVPMSDPITYSPRGAAPEGWIDDGVPLANGQRLATGEGTSYEPFVRAKRAEAAGAEVIRIDTGGQSVPVPGQIMSHDDWPFVLTSATRLSGTIYECQVQMPLRRALPLGARIDLRARGLFEIASDGTGNPAYGASRVSSITVEFREWLNR